MCITSTRRIPLDGIGSSVDSMRNTNHFGLVGYREESGYPIGLDFSREVKSNRRRDASARKRLGQG